MDMDVGNSGIERSNETPDWTTNTFKRVVKGKVVKRLVLLLQTFLPSHLIGLRKMNVVCLCQD